MEAGVDFLAVVGHWLILALVRSEWLGFGVRDWLLSGHLPVRIPPMLVMLVWGVISMRVALVALPTFAIAQFKRFFDCGRAVRCMLPLRAGRF